MKLKKIASLALAGIMAVSMLAGCKDNPSSSSEPTTPVSPVVGVAEGANARINSHAKTVLGLSYTENADLAKALEAAAKDAYDSDAVEKIGNYADSADATTATTEGAAVAKKITESLTGTSNSLNWTTNYFGLSKEGTKKALWIFTVGGAFGTDDVGGFVEANHMKNVMTNAQMPLTNGTYKADYTADIAAVKVTSADDSTKSVWVVAVMVTQDVTKA